MLTGEEYKGSLQDGRETFFEGEKIDDLVEHPLLGQTVETTAAGYEATVVSGTVVQRHGKETGERPGKLVRGGRI